MSLLKPQEGLGVGTFQYARDAMCSVLSILGVNTESEHVKSTPARIVRMYDDFFAVGREEPKWTTFDSDANDMVVVKNIHFYSLCSHHFLPFFGVAHIAYIPNGKIAGLSKLARTVKYFSHRPQVQEELTTQVADYLMEKLGTENVAVIMSCEHLCLSMRGAESPGHTTVTTALRGEFMDSDATRAELYSMLKVG